MGGKFINSKLIFAAFFLFVLISLTCVSAVDGEQMDAVALDNESTVDEIAAVDQNDFNNDEILADEEDGPGSFNQLQQDLDGCQGNIFEFERDYAYHDGDSIKYVYIDNSNMVIDGKGHTMDASNQAYLFVSRLSSNITLKNINFVNAYSSGKVAIQLGDGLIENCTFTNFNITDMNSGGAISFGENSIVKDCKFNAISADRGSAIFFLKEGRVENCTFNNCTARNTGGAIQFDKDGYVKYVKN